MPSRQRAHERMHLDIRNELEAGKIGRDQEAFDQWRHEFNNERPHESINMAFPSEIYLPSERIYTGTPEILDYEGKETRRVVKAGTIRFDSELFPVSTTLAGWDVALVPLKNGNDIEVWFTRMLLGHIDRKNSSFTPIKSKQ